MSNERKLLKRILAYMAGEYLVMTELSLIPQIEETVKEIQEILAQPEQEPINFVLEREPLSDEEIILAYRGLVKRAIGRFQKTKPAHSIGVDDAFI